MLILKTVFIVVVLYCNNVSGGRFECIFCKKGPCNEVKIKNCLLREFCYTKYFGDSIVEKGCWKPSLKNSTRPLEICNETLCNYNQNKIKQKRADSTTATVASTTQSTPTTFWPKSLPPPPPPTKRKKSRKHKESKTVLKCFLCNGMACDNGDYLMQTCEYGVKHCVTMRYRDIDGEDIHEKRCNRFRLPWLISEVVKSNCAWIDTRQGHCRTCSDDFCNSASGLKAMSRWVLMLTALFVGLFRQ